ncbi:MAG: hypothetical protein GAK31_00254 [Stenotrophomonas maltophilia]|uniref:Uncharacterized protein n=1 Tax=Stenotrophomonas maltophilia TaxID=40324 RepID=A0A7V8FIY4_STEMA|nr:MAG: hypothetical protein GAK31_00254 [Stenotrophomonas maltophilia]
MTPALPALRFHAWRPLLALLLALGNAAGAALLVVQSKGQRSVHAQLDQLLLEQARERVQGLATLLGSADAHGTDGDSFFGLYGGDGRLLHHSGPAHAEALALAHPTVTAPLHFDLQLPDGRRGRAVVLPVPLPGDGLGTAVLADARLRWDKVEGGPAWTLRPGGAALLLVIALLALADIRQRLPCSNRHWRNAQPVPATPALLPVGALPDRASEALCDPLDLRRLLLRSWGPGISIEAPAELWVVADEALLQALLHAAHAADTPAGTLASRCSLQADGLWLQIDGPAAPLATTAAALARTQQLHLQQRLTGTGQCLRIGPLRPL